MFYVCSGLTTTFRGKIVKLGHESEWIGGEGAAPTSTACVIAFNLEASTWRREAELVDYGDVWACCATDAVLVALSDMEYIDLFHANEPGPLRSLRTVWERRGLGLDPEPSNRRDIVSRPKPHAVALLRRGQPLRRRRSR